MNAREVFERRLRQAVKASARTVQEEAQEQHRFTTKTGQLERAIDTTMIDNTTAMVFVDESVAPYGPFVHQGTKPHEIRPKRKKSLRWVPGGGNSFVFARKVNHPGTRQDPFLYDALERKRGDINEIFAKATDAALNELAHRFSINRNSLNVKLKL